MGRQTAPLALLLVLLAVGLLGTDRGGALPRLPFKLAWAVLRLLGFRPRHLPALAATVVVVFQTAPIAGFRLPLVLAVVGWLGWLHRPAGSGRSPRWLRRAERRYADALRDATRNLRRPTPTTAPAAPKPSPPTRPTATPKPNPTRPAPTTPGRPAAPATPTPARPASGRTRGRDAAKPNPARPARSKPAASAAYWTAPPPALEPVLPRWLGGGRWANKRRQTP